jgi:hypothetical protein
MAVISREYGYLFIEAPRTGSTAIANGVLVKHLGGTPVLADHLRDAEGRLRVHQKHVTLAELVNNEVLTKDEVNRLFKFSAVRNPFDSLVSQYVKARTVYRRNLLDDPAYVAFQPRFAALLSAALTRTFPEWIDYRLRPKQWHRRWRQRAARRLGRSRTDAGSFLEGVDFVMRFERVQEEFGDVLRRLGIEQRIEIPVMNVTDDRDPDYRSYYDDRSRRLVAEVYRPIITRFGYQF